MGGRPSGTRIEGEDDLVGTFLAPLAAGFPGAFGLKDDCAVLTPAPGCELVLKTDPVVGGVHFLPDDDPADIAWKALAHFFGRRQLERIEEEAEALIAREELPAEAPVIGAGCGRFLAETLAGRLERPYRDFADLLDCEPEAREMAASCAPAVAVALLV